MLRTPHGASDGTPSTEVALSLQIEEETSVRTDSEDDGPIWLM